jgi:hypothetical protein
MLHARMYNPTAFCQTHVQFFTYTYQNLCLFQVMNEREQALLRWLA